MLLSNTGKFSIDPWENSMQAELAVNKSFHEDESHDLDPLKVQKIALAIFIKRFPIFVLIFLFFFIVLLYVFWRQTVSRPDRFITYASLVYNPKSVKQYQSLDAKLVTDLFVRSNVRRAVAAKMGLSPAEERFLGASVEARQVRGKSNFIMVSCKAANAEKALELNRNIVALGIEEFLRFRNSDINEYLDYLQKQKEANLRELAEYELEMQKLLDPLSLATPEQQLTKLRQTISGQMTVVSELNIKVNNLRQKVDEINQHLESIDPNIQEHLNTISYYASEEERLNRELLRSRQLYTDQNPKVKAAQAELQLIREQKEAFAKEKQLDGLNTDIAQRLRQLRSNQQTFQSELANLSQQYEIAVQELEHNKKRSENLLSSLAEENKLNNKISSSKNILRKLDEDIPSLKTLLASVPQELLVLEPANHAILTDKSLMKKAIVALFLAAILVFNVALFWVATLYFTGRIESLNEVTLLANIDCLGGFPQIRKNHNSEQQLLEISHDIFFKLKEYMKEGQVLFEAGFVGAVGQEKIRELLNINFAMSGVRHFTLICDSLENLQSHSETEPIERTSTDWRDDLLAVEVVNAGAGIGHFCVNNPNLLLSSEIEILSRDLQLLNSHYDLVVICRKTEFGGAELSFRQLTDFADCTLLFFGFRRTPRRILRYLARMKNSLSGQLCCLITGVKKDDLA